MLTAAPENRTLSPSNGLLRQSWGFLIGLAAIAALHAVLAGWYHWDRSFWGDEWGSYDAIQRPYGILLTRFGNWLTMNYYLVLLKAIHDGLGGTNWLLVAPSLIASCWLIVLTAALALRVGCNRNGALLAALFAATNPWLVGYAVTIRSYSLFAAFSTAMFLSLFDWRDSGGWRDGILCALAGMLSVLCHLNGVYGIASVGILAATWTGMRARRHEAGSLARLRRLVIPLVLAVGVAAAAHLPMLDDIGRFRSAFSTDSIRFPVYLFSVAQAYFGGGYLVIPALALLALSIVWAARRRSPMLWFVVPIVIPIVMMSLARVGNFYPAYARFLVPVLPPLLILMASFLVTVVDRRAVVAGALLLGLFAYAEGTQLVASRGVAHNMPFHKLVPAARWVSPNAKYVLFGNDQHAFGFKMSGMPVEIRFVEALRRARETGNVEIVVIDLLRLTRERPGLDIDGVKVALYRGQPREIAAHFVADLRSRFDSARSRNPRTITAIELVGLYRWLGDESAAQAMEKASRRPLTNRLD